MNKSTLIIASFVGLALAVVATILLGTTVLTPTNDSYILALDIVAAFIAGRVILGRRRPFRYFTLGIVVLSGISAGFFTSAATGYGLTRSFSGPVMTSTIVSVVLYLVAATLYGFAGTKLRVGLFGRIGLLVVLLLAVVPGLNVLGMLGFAILAFVRQPWPTQAQPAASA